MRISREILDSFLVFGLTVILFSFSTAHTLGSPEARYYAGGLGPDFDNAWGVEGIILTIYPYIPPYQFMAQWVTIIISYDPLYWVQLGYDRYRDYTVIKTQTYREKWDQYGYDLYYFAEVPQRGSWHTYRIKYQSPPTGKYVFTIDGGDRGYYVIEPYVPRELQAFVETSTTSIKIEDSYYGPSHFKGLRYMNKNGVWSAWYELEPHADPPYWVTKISNSEFKAGGGG